MVDRRSALPSMDDFATWEPVLRLMVAGHAERGSARPIHVAGRVGRHGWSLPLPGRMSSTERAAVEAIRKALARGGATEIAFSAEVRPCGRTTLGLVRPGPAVEGAIGHPGLGVLVLVEGSLAEPWRRLPERYLGSVPAPSADLESLERTLRERLPDAVGATEEEIAAVEARLGVALPDEVKVLYRVTRARWEDWGEDYGAAARVGSAVGCELFGLDDLHSIDAGARHPGWAQASTEAAGTPPGAAVQGLAGSPGWIAFGTNGGDTFAVDLTPGPSGHTGQVILVDHEQSFGAELVADSLTDFVLDRRKAEGGGRRDRPPVVARVGSEGLRTVEAAAHPALEVLAVDASDGAPFSLAPVTGLPRLRTLTAFPGALVDPLEVAGLSGLEFLELGAREWRVLLDAGSVPRTLKAAAIRVHDRNHLHTVSIANEILALWDRPQIVQTLLEGDLGPAV
ncbi:SMI1/KNR4 family protein [Streptomyces sp. NPDC018031]|uniref:SMI1/KNR4 family protein n=1 Tax=Streptomyces sp. NPDC018031 TaxID=3365033 RepID=UPI0037ADF96B